MRFPLLGKAFAIAFFGLLLSGILMRIGYLVDERAQRQHEAQRSVQASQAGEQVVIGPFLQRTCTESWTTATNNTMQEESTALSTPTVLKINGGTGAQTLYRGIFKVNGYTANLTVDADWQVWPHLQPKTNHNNSKVSCEPTQLVWALGDVRGVREAKAQVNGLVAAVLPSTNNTNYKEGFHVVLSDPPNEQTPLHTHMEVELVGTSSLSVAPLGESSSWDLQSDWPHPSFGGQFLPTKREITDAGFTAQWKVTSLASAAAKQFNDASSNCSAAAASTYVHGDGEGYSEPVSASKNTPCLDVLSVTFIDPINPYMLSDRAIKYGLLFIALTFAAVGLVELVCAGRIRRVHPIQYALVGLALCIFFLLLLSLSEHIAFWMAYSIASSACVLLLGSYAAHMLGRRRDGWLFGIAIGIMYGLMYVLLQLEQTALVIGSVSLFVVLAAVMWLTRGFDWYRMFEQARTNAVESVPAKTPTPPATVPAPDLRMATVQTAPAAAMPDAAPDPK